ncbi:MAG: cytidine deaminase family protein [Thomasclavelia sp.]|uniref:cytidine deaminase family protein n=1 Tax=Thomasclavelia sp. TaxID=3025757 RepID=UPI0039A0D53C
MDIWEKLYRKAKEEYKPREVSPFIYAHHVVCALESEDGRIYTGFCIESCGGVMDLCAERVAALNMYMSSGQTVIKRIITFRDEPPVEVSGMPCGACREFLMQLSLKNKDTEIMIDYKGRKTIKLEKLLPNWWGLMRYEKYD